MLPKIIKVAVPSPQHSPILGQLPDEQIVFNLYLSTRPLKLEYFFPVGSFTLIHSGFFLYPKLFFLEIFDSEFLFLISILTQLFDLLFLCPINLVSNAIY